MRKGYLRIWSLFFILIVLYLGTLIFNSLPVDWGDNTALRLMQVGEEHIKEEIIVYEIEEDTIKNTTAENVIMIPYYWKTGMHAPQKDVRKGYIPNIKEYRKYLRQRMRLFLGIRNSEQKTVELTIKGIDPFNTHISKGIKNQSSYFMWDEKKCYIEYLKFLESYVFFCANWINWKEITIHDEDTFVLTECMIQEKKGYCVFSDYLKEYYENKILGDNRCIGIEESKLICKYSEYIGLIESN